MLRDQRNARLGMLLGQRVEQLGIARGWRTWLHEHEKRTRCERLLRRAGGRLARPKLAASMQWWRGSYEHSVVSAAEAKVGAAEEYYRPLIRRLEEQLQAELRKGRTENNAFITVHHPFITH